MSILNVIEIIASCSAFVMPFIAATPGAEG